MLKTFIPLAFLFVIVFISSCKKDVIVDHPPQIIDTGGLVIDTLPTDTIIAPPDTVIPDPCNGHPELCDKQLDELVFALTHNSHASTDQFSFLSANQNGTIEQQLAAGIRGLGIKPYWVEGNASCGGGADGMYMYHGDPILGCVSFEEYLSVVKNFLDNNPREVILMTIEPGATIPQMDETFQATGLVNLMYDHVSNNEMPTLTEMIELNKRLFVLTSNGDSDQYDRYHSYWDYTVDVNYDVQSADQFDCTFDRGNPNGYFFQLNHFITLLSPQPAAAEQINQFDFLYNRAVECWQENNRKPNFLMVDFYASGEVVRAVDSLNLAN
ncbi:MAG: hypothetical protein ACI9YU_001532 [Flavobacteriales bacterium]|jgi:hypothetical protein